MKTVAIINTGRNKQIGFATNEATAVPALIIVAGIYLLMNLDYGIATAAAMLALTGMVALDAYGPITDNAVVAYQIPKNIEKLLMIRCVGNTTQ